MLDRRSFLAGIFMGASCASTGAGAQSYPNRLVTVVVPSPPASTPDLVARLLAEKLKPILGQPLIVENRTGAGGMIGAEAVARAEPDGHTLLCTTEWVFFSHLLNTRLSFDPHAFEPISVVVKYPLVLIGRGDLPFSSIAELIPYARSHPGKLNYASSGRGSMHQLVYEAISRYAGIDLTHVPYRGGPLAMSDLLAGRVDVSLTSINQGAPHIRDGKLKLLGIVGANRLPEFPDTPALGDVVPGLEVDAWTGIVAPPGTPTEITRRLSEAVAQVLQMPDVRTRLLDWMLEPTASTPQEMRTLMHKDAQKWAPVISAAKISLD